MSTESTNQDSDKSDHASIIVSAIKDTKKKLTSSLLPSIDNHITSESFDHKIHGLDFLEVKNGLMLSYLIDLTQLIRVRSSPSKFGVADLEPCLNRLRKMKVILDKIRPMEKKLRYSLDKLLAVSATSSTFALKEEAEIDPLSFGPNPDFMIGSGDEDDNKMSSPDNGDDDDGSIELRDDGNAMESIKESVSEDDDELKAAQAVLKLDKSKFSKKLYASSDGNNDRSKGIYKPPRLVAMPFEKDKQAEKERHLVVKERNRMRKSELLSALKYTVGEAPEEDDFDGGATPGKQREAAKRLAERDVERIKFEEDQMIRLTTSRKEKKMRNRIMRDEISNLNQISNLNNLTEGVSVAFGKGEENSGRIEDDLDVNVPLRHSNGKRRRVDNFGDIHNTGQKSGKRGKAPKNGLQKALYGLEGGKKKKNKG